MQKVKALVLLSGGLDSMLAAKVLMEQRIEVTGLTFKSYFFNSDKAKKVAEQLGIKLIEVDFSEEHLKIVKKPKYGYGKNINPCIDCHGLMLKWAATLTLPSPAAFLAGEGKLTPAPSPSPASSPQPSSPSQEKREKSPLLARRGLGEGEFFDFIATGEVLGERPMSQNKESLKLVEKIPGLQGKLLRPLSAKLLDETDLEKQGKINRDKLLDISGRSRQRQLELVKKYKIKNYASPGGGCLLTDPAFNHRMSDMLKYWPECAGDDIELLKNGRVFWFTPHPTSPASDVAGEGKNKVLVVVGRNRQECENLEKLKQSGDIIVELVREVGPTTLIRIFNFQFSIFNKSNSIFEIEVPRELKVEDLHLEKKKSEQEIFNIVLILTGYYSTKTRGKTVRLNIKLIK